MRDIHFFQRFSQKENVATNNALLLLSRLYEYDRRAFEEVLTECLGVPFPIGVSFKQQIKSGGGSVADGMLLQHSFKIIIETKVTADWRPAQLKTHLSALHGNEELRLLLLLSRDELDSNLRQEVDRIALEDGRGIQPKLLTFAGLIQTIQNALDDKDEEMLDILEDYESYAKEDGLISSKSSLLRVVPCGLTWKVNEKLNLYYEPTDRGAQQADYLGIYWEKAVRLIGKVRRFVEVRVENGSVISDDLLNPDEQKRILEASTDAESRGWKTNEFRRFTFVESFYPTEFKKKSKNGLRKHRNFDLRIWLGLDFHPGMDVQHIARKLQELEGWE